MLIRYHYDDLGGYNRPLHNIPAYGPRIKGIAHSFNPFATQPFTEVKEKHLMEVYGGQRLQCGRTNPTNQKQVSTLLGWCQPYSWEPHKHLGGCCTGVGNRMPLLLLCRSECKPNILPFCTPRLSIFSTYKFLLSFVRAVVRTAYFNKQRSLHVWDLSYGCKLWATGVWAHSSVGSTLEWREHRQWVGSLGSV